MTGNGIPEAWDLSGNVALISVGESSASSILAGALAEAGADVAVAGAREESVSTAAKSVTASGRRALELVGGFETPDSANEAIASTIEELGGLHILVNAAQVEFGKPFLDNSESEWRDLFSANVEAVMSRCQAAGRHMVGQGGGRIVNVISGLAERGLVNAAAYSATQGALQQLTRSLALEWARDGVRVNAIATGWFENERRPLEEQQQELLVRYLPLRRKGHPSDIAALLVYLASGKSDFLTGQTIFVDGGAMAHA